MLKRVVLIENILEPKSWKVYPCDDIIVFLTERFKTFPETGKIYRGIPCESNDITPKSQVEMDGLNDKAIDFTVVVYPGDFVTWALIIITLITIAAVVFLKPKMPEIENNTNNTSPNNSLSERVNKPRLNARIPDIFGEIRATPDMLSIPYKFFRNNVEYEYSFLCVGRGEYEFKILEDGNYDIREGEALVQSIPDYKIAVWGPNNSFLNDPLLEETQIKIGDFSSILNGLQHSGEDRRRCDSVDGILLDPPNNISSLITQTDTISVTSDGSFHLDPFSADDFRLYFSIGQTVTLTMTETSFGPPYTVITTGTAEVLEVEEHRIKLSNPSVNMSNWGTITFPKVCSLGHYTITTSDYKWIGPFTIDTPITYLNINIVADAGLYKDDGTTFYPFPVQCQSHVQRINADGSDHGSPTITDIYLTGSSEVDKQRGVTYGINIANDGTDRRVKVKVRRVTDADTSFNGTVVDTVKWRDLYYFDGMVGTSTAFGNLTTIITVTTINKEATELKERKLNCIVTRKIPQRVSGSTFTTDLYATKRADEILSWICRDPFIGNRPVSEIDFDSIYDTIAAVQTYFGHEHAIEFCHTFDNADTSFEEAATLVANAAFCNIYRRGNQIKLMFEKETSLSTMLYNHRNKLPNSETRTINFLAPGNNDGIELEWKNPDDKDLPSTKYEPTSQTAINPKKMSPVGIRNGLQAYFHIKREYNKLRYQRLLTEFNSTQEGFISTIGDRILVSDSTRSRVQDGEVIGQVGLEIELSQNIDLTGSTTWSIFLQLYDGTVEQRNVIAGTYTNTLILSSATTKALVYDDGMVARTTYLLTNAESTVPLAFIVGEKSYNTNQTCTIKAYNYDSRYYQNDDDYIDDVVNENGLPESIPQ